MPPDPKRPEQRAILAEVLSLLRHDLRNKLATVRNAAFYLERRAEKTPLWGEARVPSFFKLIEHELEAADSLMSDDDGSLGRLFQPQEAAVDLLVCIAGAKQAVPAAAEVVVMSPPEGAATVRADADELTLALRCLLANALEARPAREPVSVQVSRAPAVWKVEIVDGGPGLTQAERANAFQPFVSSKPGQMGLGLNIAGRIIGRWQGLLSLDARPGGGTCATLTFPPAETAGQ